MLRIALELNVIALITTTREKVQRALLLGIPESPSKFPEEFRECGVLSLRGLCAPGVHRGGMRKLNYHLCLPPPSIVRGGRIKPKIK